MERIMMTSPDRFARVRSEGWRLPLLLAAALTLAGLPGPARAADTPVAVTDAHPSLKTVDIPVDGMSCVVCAATIKKTVKSLDGVSRVEVSLEKRSARVTYAAGRLSPERIVTAIDELGYKAGTPREVE
jgi:copper ion binding protein